MKKIKQAFNCSLDILPSFRDFFEGFLNESGLEEELCQKIIIGLNELVSNIIIHANHSDSQRSFSISAEIDNSCVLMIELLHNGDSFKPQPASLPAIEDLPEGGFGLFIIEAIFDRVEYLQMAPGDNLIRLTKKI
ncbi:MAG: ATP-binding protein [Candidatus Rifleibacteriota bacterium]